MWICSDQVPTEFRVVAREGPCSFWDIPDLQCLEQRKQGLDGSKGANMTPRVKVEPLLAEGFLGKSAFSTDE